VFPDTAALDAFADPFGFGFFMTDNDLDTAASGSKSSSAKSDWDAGVGASAPATGTAPSGKPFFFKPEDFDLYVNKMTGDTYVFHGPNLPQPVERLEFTAADNRVLVHTKSGAVFDLGVKIQWLVRPYFKRAKTVYIVQTKNGETVDGIEVPMSLTE
jgi:hypothetical protein